MVVKLDPWQEIVNVHWPEPQPEPPRWFAVATFFDYNRDSTPAQSYTGDPPLSGMDEYPTDLVQSEYLNSFELTYAQQVGAPHLDPTTHVVMNRLYYRHDDGTIWWNADEHAVTVSGMPSVGSSTSFPAWKYGGLTQLESGMDLGAGSAKDIPKPFSENSILFDRGLIWQAKQAASIGEEVAPAWYKENLGGGLYSVAYGVKLIDETSDILAGDIPAVDVSGVTVVYEGETYTAVAACADHYTDGGYARFVINNLIWILLERQDNP